jgi:hypothetical protein
MKLLLGYMVAAAVLVVLGFTPADAKHKDGKKHRHNLPEPATMGVLGALAVGSLIAGKIIRRK